MATLIRIAALLATIYAVFVYFTAEKNREQLQLKQEKLKASQTAFEGKKVRYEKAAKKANALNGDIRLMRVEVNRLKKKS